MTKVKHLIEMLLRHGNMETRVFIMDSWRERDITLSSGTGIKGIKLRAATPKDVRLGRTR